MNPRKFKRTSFCDKSELGDNVKDRFFVKHDELHADLFEITKRLKTIKWGNCIQVGFWVYNNAKLKMLSFFYDCLCKYFRDECFMLLMMDTDSLYLSHSASFDDILIPEKRDEFYLEYENWFPRYFCDEHRAEFLSDPVSFDRSRQCCKDTYAYYLRQPGLMKVEYEGGTSFCGLQSKNYFCDGPKKKLASKGLQKSNPVDFETFLGVLTSRQSVGGVNKGFRCRDRGVYTYKQQRKTFSYFYAKRRVLEDGVSTLPLNV